MMDGAGDDARSFDGTSIVVQGRGGMEIFSWHDPLGMAKAFAGNLFLDGQKNVLVWERPDCSAQVILLPNTRVTFRRFGR